MRSTDLLTLPLTVAVALVLWTTTRLFGPVALWISAWLVWLPFRRHPEARALRNLLWFFLAIWILHQARWVVYPLVGGILLAYILTPPVERLEARRVKRPLAAAISLLPIGIVTVLAVFLLVPALIDQVSALVAKIPAAYELVERHARPLLDRTGVSPRPELGLPAWTAADSLPVGFVPTDSAAQATGRMVWVDSLAGDSVSVPLAAAPGTGLPAWIQQLTGNAEALLGKAVGSISGVGKGVGKVLQWVGVLFLTPIVAFYLLMDWRSIGRGLLSWTPPAWHPMARRLSENLKLSLSVYLRGQLLVAAVEAVLFSVLFRIAGLSDPIALGVLCGLFSLIPILGFAGTVVLVFLSAVTGPHVLSSLVRAGIGLAVINILEGQVIVPKIQGAGFGLHPLVVLMGVLFFGALFGFMGVLLAVPAMAVLKGFLPDLRAAWESRVLQTAAGSPQTGDNRPGEDEGGAD